MALSFVSGPLWGGLEMGLIVVCVQIGCRFWVSAGSKASGFEFYTEFLSKLLIGETFHFSNSI